MWQYEEGEIAICITFDPWIPFLRNFFVGQKTIAAFKSFTEVVLKMMYNITYTSVLILLVLVRPSSFRSHFATSAEHSDNFEAVAFETLQI